MRSLLSLLGLGIVAIGMAPQPIDAHHIDYNDDRPFIRLEGIGRICFAQKEPGVTFRRVPRLSATVFPNDAAIALVRQGHPQLALGILERFPLGSYEYFDVARSVATALAETEQTAQALTVLNRVEGGDLTGARFQDNAAFPVVFALLEAEQTDAAIEAAALIQDDEHHGEAIAKIVTHLIQGDEVDRALALAESIAVPFYRVAALSCAGVALADQGDIQQADAAFMQASQIVQSAVNQTLEPDAFFTVSESVGVVVLGLVEIGAFNRANEFLDLLEPATPDAVLALPLVRAIFFSASLQRVQETSGLDAAYRFLTDTIQEPSFGELELPAVIGFAAYQELRHEHYRDLLTQLETHFDELDSTTHGMILGFAAVERAENQDFEEATMMFRTSLQLLEEGGGDEYGIWRIQNFLAIAKEMRLAGNVEAAWQFIEDYALEPEVAIANLGVLVGLGCSNWDRLCHQYYSAIERNPKDISDLGWLDFYAFVQIAQIGHYGMNVGTEDFLAGGSLHLMAKVAVLIEATEDLVNIGKYDEALALVQEAQSFSQTIEESGRDWILNRIALTFSEGAQFTSAIAFAEQIEDDTARTNAFLVVMTNLVQSGNYDKALEIRSQVARDIEEHNVRIGYTNWLVVSAAALAQDGQFDQALAVADKIDGQYSQSIALRAIAMVLAQSAQYDQAIELTEHIGDLDQRVDALNAIAIALIHAAQIDRSLSVLERAFAIKPGI